MEKKKILSTTIMFVVIVAAIVGFKSIFGDENTLVGVAGITAALSLLGTDYTINPLRNTVYFVGLEIVLGVGAFLAANNSILALIITFILIFTVILVSNPSLFCTNLLYMFSLWELLVIEMLSSVSSLK